MRTFGYILAALFSLGLLGLIAGIGLFSWVIATYGEDLPDYNQLQKYEPPVVARVHAGDGRLMAEFAKEKRIYMPVDDIPKLVKQAFISAEDKKFYTHHGLDYMGITRAILTNLQNLGSDRRLVGASTITQQVAKNFLLTNEVSFARKIKEAILAYRMEKALPKDRLLELYLNDIFLGQRAYGVGAAALTYFGKAPDELSIEEAAYLAALPKAPNNYHPVLKRERAIERRNWVIDRMQEDDVITADQAKLAKAKPLYTLIESDEERDDRVRAPYFAEEIRRFLIDKYGEDGLSRRGFTVRSTLDPHYQSIAERVFLQGLIEYDIRHGYRGPVKTFETMDSWREQLKTLGRPEGMLSSWRVAVVLDVAKDKAEIGFENGDRGIIPLSNLLWAAKDLGKGRKGAAVSGAGDVLKVGDVIFAFAEKDAPDPAEKTEIDGKPVYRLRQVPKVQGGMVVMDPHTGRVLAMQGGWYYGASEFNRATQAQRQPGSAFKPFVYLTALEHGYTPSSIILDAPVVFDQGPGLKKWRPKNYNNEYYGPTPLRVGVEKSRNLMTVRLANQVGIKNVSEMAKRFGIDDDMPPHLANALGATETTVLRLTTAYAMLVNGGKQVTPTFIDRVQDRWGKTVYRADQRPCEACGPLEPWKQGMKTPVIPDVRAQIADARHAYQMVSILEGVVQRGTGVKIKALGYPIAGKTGTTNDSKDVWFIGFSPDLVAGVYVGFDEPQNLGHKETGSSVAVPIFKAFMEEALKGKQAIPFRMPPGISLVQVNPKSGMRARPGDKTVIWEAFLKGQEPGMGPRIVEDAGGLETESSDSYNNYSTGAGSTSSRIQDGSSSISSGTGGLY